MMHILIACFFQFKNNLFAKSYLAKNYPYRLTRNNKRCYETIFLKIYPWVKFISVKLLTTYNLNAKQQN